MKRTVVIVKKNAIQSDLDAAMLQVTALGAANATLTATNASQAGQISSLTSQVATLTATNASQAGQISSLTSQVATLTATNASQAGQISSLTSQVATLTATNASQAGQINVLTTVCGGNSVTVLNTSFTGHANDVQTQGAKPASGFVKESYSVFISLTVPSGSNCIKSFGLDWAGGATPPAWNAGGWNTLGTITVKPWNGTGNTIAMFNYQVVAGGCWLHFYVSRRSSDSGSYLRVNRVEFGTF